MTALDVARKDFEDAIRSRALWVTSALFVVLLSLSASFPLLVFDDPSARLAVAFLQGPATELVLPMLAILVGYRSIVGERERGSITFLLGLPHSRLDVLTGKLLGRSAVLAVPVVLGFLATGVFVTIVYGRPPITPFVSYALVTVLAGTAFVTIAVGVSALVDTRFQAISILVGGFVLATAVWDRIPAGIHYLVAGEFPGVEPSWWVVLATQLNPIRAYSTAGLRLLPETPHVHFEVDDAGVAAEQGATIAAQESAYVFTETWFVIGVLVAWIVVLSVAGYHRFNAADLV